MLRSLATMTQEAGRPPRWELAGNETDVMVGDPGAAVLVEGYLKGLADFDGEATYQTLKKAALAVGSGAHRPGNASYLELGYVPMEESETVWGPVSTTLEYAYADWALAQMARALGHEADAVAFEKQSLRYRTLFDPGTGMLRPKLRDGSWLEPFDPDASTDPTRVELGGPGYVEGTAHQYAFFAPHDIAGLIELHGGGDAFVSDLQEVFDRDRFVLWNEPDMAYPYLFNYVPGQAHRTQLQVAQAREQFFTTGPDGLPGNDDTGALSAWFVFSALGLYPACPACGEYQLGSPLFERAEITLQPSHYSGNRFVIQAPGAGPGAALVSGVSLDGESWSSDHIKHSRVIGGGTLEFQMTSGQ